VKLALKRKRCTDCGRRHRKFKDRAGNDVYFCPVCRTEERP